MNAKIQKILEAVDSVVPESEILDSYFNASDERRKKIEDSIYSFNNTFFEYDLGDEDGLDFLIKNIKGTKYANNLINFIKDNV